MRCVPVNWDDNWVQSVPAGQVLDRLVGGAVDQDVGRFDLPQVQRKRVTACRTDFWGVWGVWRVWGDSSGESDGQGAIQRDARYWRIRFAASAWEGVT